MANTANKFHWWMYHNKEQLVTQTRPHEDCVRRSRSLSVTQIIRCHWHAIKSRSNTVLPPLRGTGMISRRLRRRCRSRRSSFQCIHDLSMNVT